MKQDEKKLNYFTGDKLWGGKNNLLNWTSEDNLSNARRALIKL